MSGGDDSFLARWSRRKRASHSGDTEATRRDTLEDTDADAPAPQPDPPPSGPTEAEAVVAAEPLPRIEDLTSESDLTAFLRKEVPAALRSAAMRRMWSLEPGIRDYIGPAEYAWDFNQPGSMAGFGPLDAKDTMVEFLSRTARAIGTAREEPVQTTGTQPSADVPPGQEGNIAPDTDAEPDPAEIPPANDGAASRVPETPPDAIPASSREVEPAPPSHSTGRSKPSQSAAPLTRPHHGGAMPR